MACGLMALPFNSHHEDGKYATYEIGSTWWLAWGITSGVL